MQRLFFAFALLSLLSPYQAVAGEWSAEKVHQIAGFHIPDCVVVDAENQQAYVSNVVAKVEGEGYDRFWKKDGTGFVSRLQLPEKLDALHWRKSTSAFALNGPKGLCVHDGWLWAADIDRVVRFRLDDPSKSEIVNVDGAQGLNDMASDGKFAYVTDIAAGKCYRLRPGKTHAEIPAPPGINGITFHDGQMFAASWGKKEIYELDPAGKKQPVPFGLTSHFTTPDGIEVLDDGTFIVSDSEGNKVVTIAADRKTVRTLIEGPAPADFGLDRKKHLLYVPMFFKGRVDVYHLKKK